MFLPWYLPSTISISFEKSLVVASNKVKKRLKRLTTIQGIIFFNVAKLVKKPIHFMLQP